MSQDKPWETEPNHVMFMSDAGYVCEIKRHDHFGHLNGYIYIPKGHPDFGKTYMELYGYDENMEELPGEAAPDVHGGWTYSDTRGEVTIFGFDCNHADDYSPRHVALLATLPGTAHETLYKVENYRTIEFVTEQLEQAARQFKERERKES